MSTSSVTLRLLWPSHDMSSSQHNYLQAVPSRGYEVLQTATRALSARHLLSSPALQSHTFDVEYIYGFV